MGLYRKVIRITAEDSPNVQRALLQQKNGVKPDGEMITPGVLSWQEYMTWRTLWDKQRQCVALDARFWEGDEIYLFPEHWINLAEMRALALAGKKRTTPRGLGCDPAEGGDKTSWAISDREGLLALISKRTPDTSVITSETIAIAKQWGVPSDRWVFDRGGGGLSHADRLRQQGYRGIRTLAFGESLVPDPKQVASNLEQRLEDREQRYVYTKRRAQLFGFLSLLLDPSLEEDGPRFAIPANIMGLDGDPTTVLRDQLTPIPKTYDEGGRLYLLPKHAAGKSSDKRTLVKLIGHSPDEADAVTLSVYAAYNDPETIEVRVLF